jgi:hypothetical protein
MRDTKDMGASRFNGLHYKGGTCSARRPSAEEGLGR